MKRTLTVFPFLLFLIAVPWKDAAAQATKSRFLPERSYSVSIKQTLSGFDGFQDVIPVTNTQRMRIETGEKTGGGVPVTLTVFTAQSGDAAREEREQWKFRFTAGDDGSISDVQTLSALEELDEGVATAILTRQLEQVLFHSVYALSAGKLKASIESEIPRDGAEDFVDVTYTLDRSEIEERMRAEDAPMVTEDSGTAVFHTGEQFFIERRLDEVNRIHVDMDDYGEAKDVVMNKDLRISVTISPR
ncbi:MAG: hypothetical protein RRA94_07230 [Bacteroidota bacterium]|nr:hypothetical protein [Bacteroidota bacterium]